MAAYQKYTEELNRDLVRLYRNGLDSMNAKIAKLWKSSQPATGDVLEVLRDEVKTLIEQRKRIIRDNLPRGAERAYSDILHQAARLVGLEVNLAPLSETEAAALIRKRPKSVPSFEKLLKKHADESAFKANVRAKRELEGAETLADTKSALKRVLTQDANDIIRFTNAEGTRVVNNAVNLAFETLADPAKTINKLIKSAGIQLVKVWIHDSPVVPREYHRDVLHGSLPDKNGLWYQDGDSADGPGGFSDPGKNVNCRCSIDVMTVQEYLGRFGRSHLAPWSYLPEGSL